MRRQAPRHPMSSVLIFLAVLAPISSFAQEGKPMEDYAVPLEQKLWNGASPAAAPGESAKRDLAGGGLRWELAKSTSIRISDIIHDWTAYNALVFTVNPSKPSSSKVTIVVSSEDKAAEGPDYFAISLIMDFEGPKTFEIPFDEFGKARKPVGWNKTDSLSFNSAWDPDAKPDPTVVLTFTDIRLRAGSKVKGPRMTDKDLFDALDLDRPGLEKVKEAVGRNDLAAARHELAERLRARSSPRWFADPRRRPTIGMPPVAARAEKGKGGRFAAKIRLDAAGWQHVVLPKSAFEKQGSPLGWDGVSGLRLQMIGKGAEREPGLVLYLDDVKLTGPAGEQLISDFEREPVGWTGLVLSDEQAKEGLPRRQAGRQSGKWWFMNITPAIQCQAVPRNWSRFDALDFWLYVAAPSKTQVAVVADSYAPDTTFADMVLAHKFYMGAFKDHIFDFGPRIDWSSNAMSEGESKTVEWNAQLNRHFHFNSLRKAYWETGDEKYAKELADEIVGWVEDCPLLLFRSGNSPYHHAWETLNTAVRLEYAWPDTLYDCLLSPSFTDDALVTMMKSMAEQARHLIKWPTGGNWLTAESTGIYTVGTVFPEFKEAADWRKIAIERLYKQLEDEVYPDGLEYEVALGYNLWVLSEYIRIIEIAHLNDALGEIPSDYQARIEKMFNYLMYDCMPDGIAVGLNDSGNAAVRARLIEGYRYFPQRHDFPYVASNGLQGRPPKRTSCAFPYTGHYVMRTAWDKDARMLHFDAGLFGFGHQHEDKLHFIVYAFGKQLLLDSGNYMYDASRWRKYVLSTRAHNTILVDGEGQNRRGQKDTYVWPKPWDAPAPPTDTRFVTASGFDYAVGSYNDGYSPKRDKSVAHTRQIFFVKPDYWIVADTLRAVDEKTHTCDSLFHIAAADAAADPKTKAVTTAEKSAANLAIVPLDDPALKVAVVKGTTEEPVQGWSGVGGPWRPVPTAIFSREWKGVARLLYVIYPGPAGAPLTPPVITPLAGAQGASAICIDRAGHPKAYFLAQTKGGTPMEAGDVSTDAEAAFACAGEGDDFRLALVQGTRLKAGACALTFSKPADASVEGATGVYLLDYQGDSADVCSLQLPEDQKPGFFEKPGFSASRPSATSRVQAQVYKLDKGLERQAAVKIERAGEAIRFAVEPHSLYEITFGAPKSWKEMKEEKAESAKRQKIGMDFPLRPQPPLPPAKGVKVVIQAEDFFAQGGGEVTLTDKKVNAQGKAFLNWNDPGHWLEWRFKVPQDGEYRIALKCCTEALGPQRALVLDGAFPDEPSQCLDLPSTGGFSNDRDDWRIVTLSDPKTGKSLPFHLRAGDHTLRLINLQDSMNLDFIVVYSPDQEPSDQ